MDGLFILEHPIKMDDLGEKRFNPLFSVKHPQKLHEGRFHPFPIKTGIIWVADIYTYICVYT